MPEKRKEEVEPICTGSPHEKEGVPPWPAPLGPGPCCVPPSPARLSKLILVKMSP